MRTDFSKRAAPVVARADRPGASTQMQQDGSYLDSVVRHALCASCKLDDSSGGATLTEFSAARTGVSANSFQIPCVKSPSLEPVADFGNSVFALRRGSESTPGHFGVVVRSCAESHRRSPGGFFLIKSISGYFPAGAVWRLK